MPAHKHAALMLQYAQDAAETDKPWERWQVQSPVHGPWSGFIGDPTWDVRAKYRRKPRTIRIGEFDVPEPLREAPALGSAYMVPNMFTVSGATYRNWDSDTADFIALERGLAHLTSEAAELHAKALISLSAKP